MGKDLEQDLLSEQIRILAPILPSTLQIQQLELSEYANQLFSDLMDTFGFPVRPKRSKKFSAAKTATSRATTAFGAGTKGEQHISNVRSSYYT